MNADQVRQRIATIADTAGDPEVAHSHEDALYLDLLTAIAKGECDDPQACAREAVKSAEMDFPRWCA